MTVKIAELRDPDGFVRDMSDVFANRWEDALYAEAEALKGCVLSDAIFNRLLARAKLNDVQIEDDWLTHMEGITTDEQWAKIYDRPKPMWTEVTTREQAIACGFLPAEEQREEPPLAAVASAIAQAEQSPCAKSHRGAAIVEDGRVVTTGCNHPPRGRSCLGTQACRDACRKLCVHAEIDALRKVADPDAELEVVHVKVKDGVAVPSGNPSCWQCARDMLDDGRVVAVWLLLETGWRRYTITEFYDFTAHNERLPLLPIVGARS